MSVGEITVAPRPEVVEEQPPARAPRRTRTTRRRRRNWGPFIVVALAIAAGLLAAALGTPRDATDVVTDANGSDTATDDGSATEPVVSEEPLVVLGHRSADGRVDALVMYGFNQSGVTSAVVVPTATEVVVPAFGRQPIAEVARLGSDAILALAIENAFGVAIDELVLLDDAQLGAVLAPAGITIDAQPFEATIESWQQALRDPVVADEVDALDPRLATFTARASAPVQYLTMPDEPVERAVFMVDSFPSAALNGGAPRPRVEVRDGTGVLAFTPSVTALVVAAGGEIVQTDNVQGFGIGETQVTYHGDEHRAAAERFAAALGVAGVAPASAPADGEPVDVTIVVGGDLAEPPPLSESGA